MNKPAAKQQTIDNNIQSIKKPKITRNYAGHDYECVFSYRQYPISDAFLYNLSLKLVEWADKNPEATKLNKFLTENKIHWATFDDWRKRNKDLDHAATFALRRIGDRREDGAMGRKYAENTVLRSMHFYDPDWKAGEEWRSKLNESSTAQASTFNIHMDKIPEVSEKK